MIECRVHARKDLSVTLLRDPGGSLDDAREEEEKANPDAR
jgi:hypothetical protein